MERERVDPVRILFIVLGIVPLSIGTNFVPAISVIVIGLMLGCTCSSMC